MADEIKKIITIDARQGAGTLRDFQKACDNARIELMRLDSASEEYQRQLVALKAAQADYNKEMRMAVKEEEAVKGSYNDLLNQLNRLKDAWKATGSEAERAKLAQQINDVKGQLDTLDHSIGNYQRNVGNYWGSLRNGIMKVTAAIVALRGAWNFFRNAMEQTQNTGDALKSTLGGIKDSYESLMAAAVSGDWSAFSGGFWAVYDAAVAAREAIDQLGNTQLAFDYLTQKNTTEFNKYFNIWRDKESTEEQKAAAKEQMRAIIDAQTEYAKTYGQTALDAYRALVVKEAGEANITAARVTAEQFRQAMLIDVGADPKRGRAEIERQYKEYTVKLKQYGENNLTAQDNLKRQYADVIAIHAMLKLMKDDELQGLSQILTGMERAKQTAQQMEKRMLRVQGNAGTGGGSAKKPKGVDYDLATSDLLPDYEEEVETATEWEKWLADLRARSEARMKAERDKEISDLIEFGETYRDLREKEVLVDEFKRKKEHDLILASIKEQEYKQKVEEQIERERVQTIQKSASAIGAIMGSVASAYQAYITQRVEGGEISEKQAEQEFENVKAIQYAQTWINALAGSVSVWAGEGTNLTKAVQSASVLAQGIAATMQIANTTLGSVSAATKAVTSAAVAAPVVINAMPQVQALTSASQQEEINARQGAQRVYVVYSDIAQAGRKVAVTQGESRF